MTVRRSSTRTQPWAGARPLALAAGLAVALSLASTGAAQPRSVGVADGFSLAVAGDLLGPYSSIVALQDPEFEKVASLLRAADAAFANHESSAFDFNTFQGTKAAENGGGTPLFDPALTRDFKSMGLDLVSLANNHAGDWGAEGLSQTLRTVKEAGLVQAGAGASLTAARDPGVFVTPRGNVALIATASTYVGSTPAADAQGELRPRTGISVLRTEAALSVSPTQMQTLRTIAADNGLDVDAASLKLGKQAFVAGAGPGMTYSVNQDDQAALLKSVGQARSANNLVLLSIHAHETSGPRSAPRPADFLQDFFHAAIDAGADVVVRHGPHELDGVEIYKGRPIFYGMGSLFFGVGGVSRTLRGARMPDSFYDSAVAVTEFKSGAPALVRIYPLTIRTDARATLGVPERATPKDAARILGRLAEASRVYGTEIDVVDGVGVIRIRP